MIVAALLHLLALLLLLFACRKYETYARFRDKKSNKTRKTKMWNIYFQYRLHTGREGKNETHKTCGTPFHADDKRWTRHEKLLCGTRTFFGRSNRMHMGSGENTRQET